ncbi:hypothetical protein [Bosea sp. R86505]|uniref:hypothetical protein n=1 Tax=Bosea sp. R86505 TaxID=3101710 RepID=UPI00366D215B
MSGRLDKKAGPPTGMVAPGKVVCRLLDERELRELDRAAGWPVSNHRDVWNDIIHGLVLGSLSDENLPTSREIAKELVNFRQRLDKVAADISSFFDPPVGNIKVGRSARRQAGHMARHRASGRAVAALNDLIDTMRDDLEEHAKELEDCVRGRKGSSKLPLDLLRYVHLPWMNAAINPKFMSNANDLDKDYPYLNFVASLLTMAAERVPPAAKAADVVAPTRLTEALKVAVKNGRPTWTLSERLKELFKKEE